MTDPRPSAPPAVTRRRILVLGGTGFIGPAVVARLVEAGHDVTLFHRGEHELSEFEALRHIHGDRARLVEFRDQLRTAAPGVVLDMAPMSAADAETAMSAFRGIAGRIVAISSVDVYRAYGRMHGSEPGPPEPMPLREESPLREKLFPYRGEMGAKFDDYDKIPVEQAMLGDADLPGTILRLPAVHGERDNQRRLRAEVERMDASRPAIILPMAAHNWRWSRSYVGNVADAIVLARHRRSRRRPHLQRRRAGDADAGRVDASDRRRDRLARRDHARPRCVTASASEAADRLPAGHGRR